MAFSVSDAALLPRESGPRQAVEVGGVGGGGHRTTPSWTASVPEGGFAEALRRSLAAHAILASGGGGGSHRLDARLVGVGRPTAGFGMEAKATVLCHPVAKRTGRAASERRIVSSAYTARCGAALHGDTRPRLAKEGAVRENIQAFIAALAEENRTNPGAFGPAVAELPPRLRRPLPA